MPKTRTKTHLKNNKKQGWKTRMPVVIVFSDHKDFATPRFLP